MAVETSERCAAATDSQPRKDDAPPSFLEALGWCVAMSALFMVVYSACNWITAARSDVGTLYFAWEQWIPFVPVMIIPYWSIDLFFAGSMFVCRQRSELHLLAKRLTLAILVAGVCFLLFPLKLAVPRPEVDGWLGPLFGVLRSFDQPYNLAPSLHIALRSILWMVYVRHTHGLLQTAVRLWFILIGVSTLLVWQHHVIDIVTGQLLAMVCFYVFPEASFDARRCPRAAELAQRNARVGWLYAAGSIVCLVAAVLLAPWGLLLVWPAFALGNVAAAYFTWGPAIFRKSAGRLPWSTRICLAPYLAGAWISYQCYRKRSEPFVQIHPHLYIGRLLSRHESQRLANQGVHAVLDLAAEFSETPTLGAMTYHHLPVLDLTAPTPAQLEEAVEFLEEQTRRGPVYVHCTLGYSRSACIAAAWLLAIGQCDTVDEAAEAIRRQRPQIVLGQPYLDTLQSFLDSRLRRPTASALKEIGHES